MTILDDLEKIKKIDQSSLVDSLIYLPQQFKNVWRDEKKIEAPANYQKVKNIVFCGMGCDRTTGDLVKKIVSQECFLPIEVLSDYQIPKYINKETLMVFLSYSGNTSETLFSLKSAQKKKAKIFVISGGGRIIEIIRKYHLPSYQFLGSGPSRANLGYLISPLLILLSKLKFINIKKENFSSLINTLIKFNQLFDPQQKAEKNVAKYLAYQIFDRLPFIIGAEHLSPVAQRWKKEFNENSKSFSLAEEAPEVFHNTVEGIEFPSFLKNEILFLFLASDFYQSQTKQAFQVFKDILQKKDICFEYIPALGDNLLTQSLTSVLLGDWVSFYLAILNQIDPAPVKNIELIKNIRL